MTEGSTCRTSVSYQVRMSASAMAGELVRRIAFANCLTSPGSAAHEGFSRSK